MITCCVCKILICKATSKYSCQTNVAKAKSAIYPSELL